MQRLLDGRTGACRDAARLAAILAIALVVGLYLIKTTVLISQDAVVQVRTARLLAEGSTMTQPGNPAGYPFLILCAHKIVRLAGNDDPVHSWILAGQIASLGCRLAALVGLYFIGRRLVGGGQALLALLILVILPEPARLGSDVLKEWPYLLCVVWSLLLVLRSADKIAPCALGLAGFLAGLGYTIRPEAAHLLIVGFTPVAAAATGVLKLDVPRWRLAAASAFLLAGFAGPVAAYSVWHGYALPTSFSRVLQLSVDDGRPAHPRPPQSDATRAEYAKAATPFELAALPAAVAGALGKNLRWVFLPPLALGIWRWLRSSRTPTHRLVITTFIAANIALLAVRYCLVAPHISMRWLLPITVVTVFFVPDGLNNIAVRLSQCRPASRTAGACTTKKPFVLLLIVCMGACLPGLLTPLGHDKRIRRETANWLRSHTEPNDVVAARDSRIALYAGRPVANYDGRNMPFAGQYLVQPLTPGETPFAAQIAAAREIFRTEEGSDHAAIAVYDLGASLIPEVSLAGFQWRKTAKNVADVTLAFQVHRDVEDDWVVKLQVHPAPAPNGSETRSPVMRLRPDPPSSTWRQDQKTAVTSRIAVPPQGCELTLQLFLPAQKRQGRKISLGTVRFDTSEPAG